MEEHLLRIIDANANRVREGLRVVEEYVRFVVEDEEKMSLLKGFRHQVSDLLAELGIEEQLLRARESQRDIGARVYSQEEARRTTFSEVVLANLKRAQEGLRVLEEYSKLLSAQTGLAFKDMRFQLYTLEKNLALNHHSLYSKERTD